MREISSDEHWVFQGRCICPKNQQFHKGQTSRPPRANLVFREVKGWYSIEGMTNEPLVFEPLAMERVWGGRRLEVLYGKSLPPGVPIGEIWEIVDRWEAQSVVHCGPLQGTTLNELWTRRRKEIFGASTVDFPGHHFPILVKLLDAREKLSLQVHPTEKIAAALKGEPKTEVWYFVRCAPGARIYAGIKAGVTRELFEAGLRQGTVEEVLHTIDLKEGDSIFIPSGRLHAIGEGNVLVEIQQNSDTTYRVFDWNRVGLDGRPRTLHIKESLACIDWSDVEPAAAHIPEGQLAECPFFQLEKMILKEPCFPASERRFAIVTVLEGSVQCGSATFSPGCFFLVPACCPELALIPQDNPSTVLLTRLPKRKKRDSLSEKTGRRPARTS